MTAPPGALTITFHRIGRWRSDATAVRDGGVTLRIPGYGPPAPLPHDLAHCGVEHELGLRHGFWGSVAAGAVFPSMAVVAGRRRPHAEERSKAVIKANGPLITRAEVVVGGPGRREPLDLLDHPGRRAA